MTDIAPGSFNTAMVRVGLKGVQLNAPLTDLLPEELARLANWVPAPTGLEVRPGLTNHTLGGAPGTINAIRRAYAPASSPAGFNSLFWGVDHSWVRSVNGAAADILEDGFSGDPLTMIPIRKPLASGSWMLVADRSKMRKAGLAATGSLPIGLPAPVVALTTALSAAKTLAVAAFEAADGTAAASWSTFAGPDDTGKASGAAPTKADVTGTLSSAVAFTLVPGSATAGFQSYAVCPKVLNLSSFGGGPFVAEDDFIHLQLRMSDPSNIREVRIYFVCSPLSLTADVPGTALINNSAAYMHAFTPSDYEAFVAGLETGDAGAARAAATTLIGNIPVGPGRLRPPGSPATGTAVPRAGLPSTQAASGANTWVEFSSIGLPLRRSDFVAIGTAGKPGTDWATISGIYLLFWTRVNAGLTVSLDDCYITGGAGPDTVEPGAQKYDYRFINLDTRTGARSNGSPTQADASWLDSARRGITLDPPAYGDTHIRQEFFRRGGSLTDNWYFVGQNGNDGGTFNDTLADVDIVAADVLPTDNFQPVATLNDNGTTVLAQPVPIVFGPLDDGIFCALGDPYRPGHLYSCIAGHFDAWPSTSGYVIELCAPSEELMNGCVWGGQGFVLSRERGYAVHANPSEPGIQATPTECKPGLAARWGFCTGPGGIYYVARDAVRVTGGQDSTILSDQIRPLFNGETVNGRLPIDFHVPTEIRLALHNSDLWFCYQDTGGTRRKAVYSLLYRNWRFVDFPVAVSGAVYSDETEDAQTAFGANRLLVGDTAGHINSHEGFTDLGVAITASFRTGAWTFGAPRAQKALGDLVLDLNLQGASASIQTYLNAETATNPAQVATSAARTQVYLQPFLDTAGGDPQQARSVSVNLSVVAPTTSRPIIFYAGVSAQPLPEIATTRTLVWGTWSSLSDKYLKGIILDADTYDTPIVLRVEADGATVQTFTIRHNGRRVANYTWPQVLGRVFQVTPATDLPSQVHTLLPIFDEEPYALARWETQLLDLGLDGAGWGSVLSADVCYRSTEPTVLTVACYLSTGVLLTTVTETLPSSAGAKVKTFVPFSANKGVLFKFIFATLSGNPTLTLYQEESRVRVQPWSGGEAYQRLWGNDDTDPTRAMTNSIIAAERSGGGS